MVSPLKFPRSKKFLWSAGLGLLLLLGLIYYAFLPVAEVATVRRGTAVSAVYGTVRIEPAFVVHVRAQKADSFAWPISSPPAAAPLARA